MECWKDLASYRDTAQGHIDALAGIYCWELENSFKWLRSARNHKERMRHLSEAIGKTLYFVHLFGQADFSHYTVKVHRAGKRILEGLTDWRGEFR